MVKGLEETTDKEAAIEQLSMTKSYLDKLARRGIVHKKKAANQKSRLEKMVNSLG